MFLAALNAVLAHTNMPKLQKGANHANRCLKIGGAQRESSAKIAVELVDVGKRGMSGCMVKNMLIEDGMLIN